MAESQPDDATLRWLLRPLVEGSFLRLYLEDQDDLPLRCFEDAFWSLPTDPERPESARGGAWKILERWLDGRRAPVEWYVAVLAGLRSNWLAKAGEMARAWALPELFLKDEEEAAKAEELNGYHEIHCHLRGGVPFLALWRSWLENERHRRELRRQVVRAGHWQKNWAELVKMAHGCRAELERGLGLNADPCARWARQERDFIKQLALKVVSRHDRSLEQAAVRYLAICAALMRAVLHQRGRTGLSAFTTSYDRYSSLQKIRGGRESNHTRLLVQELLHRFESEGAVAVELRPTLERRPRDLRKKLADVACGYFDYLAEANSPLLMGIVPSLFKQEGLRPGAPARPEFWEAQGEVWREQVRMLLVCLDEVPALRWFVVGIDAAGKEAGWLAAALGPALELVRRYNRDWGVAAARPGRCMSLSWLQQLVKGARVKTSDADAVGPEAFEALNGSYVSRIRLGITVHAGEDFVDPLTGLRNIWEAVHDLDLRAGDRIGHAIAAALDKKRLRELLERRASPRGESGVEQQTGEKSFRILKPRGTHLLDLAWKWQLTAKEPAERGWVAARLAEVGARAFGAPGDAARLARELGRRSPIARPALPAVRFGDPTEVAAEDREWVLLDEEWFAAYERCRQQVVAELVHRDVVVESCPTSNCVVANLERPPLEVLVAHGGLRVAVGTDDPGLLGAWPRDELKYLDDALRHLDDKQRRHLKQRLRDENRRASFVIGL